MEDEYFDDINLDDIDLIVEEKTVETTDILDSQDDLDFDSDLEFNEIMQQAMTSDDKKTFLTNDKSFGKKFDKSSDDQNSQIEDKLALNTEKLDTVKPVDSAPDTTKKEELVESPKEDSVFVKLMKKMNKTILIATAFGLCTVLLMFSGEPITIEQNTVKEPSSNNIIKKPEITITTPKKEATAETLSLLVYQMNDVIILLNNLQSVSKEETIIVNKYYNKEIESKDVTRFFKQSLSKKEDLVAAYNKSYKLTEADSVFNELDRYCREAVNASKVTLKSVPSGHSTSAILNAFKSSLQTQEASYKVVYQNIEQTLQSYSIIYEIVDNQLLISKTE